MANISEKTYGCLKVVEKDSKYGVTDLNGNIIVPFGKYAWIDGFDKGLARVHGYGITKTKNGECHSYTVPFFIFDENNDIIANPNWNKEEQEVPAKWGIINEKGEEVLPMEYDNIWKFYGKNRFSTRVEKDGKSRQVYFHDLNPNLPKRGISQVGYSRSYNGYGRNYGEYAGSYAQDVMGYSDDVINDAFDGDPDAYWNID